jgi:hypothetical protein
MKKFTLVVIVIFLSFARCQKDDRNEDLCYSSTLVSQINSGDVAVHGLTYNSNCLIYESTEPYMYKRYSYDAGNILKRVEVAYSFSPFSCVMIPGQSLESDPRKASVSEYSEFEYDNSSRLIKKSYYFINNGNPQLTSYQTYDYENDKIVRYSIFNPQGKLNQYHDLIYDERGNIIRDDQYSNNSVLKLVYSLTCEFDNKNNPYLVFAGEGRPGKYTNRNNIIKESYVYNNGIPGSETTTEYLYEYNSLDYPVRINKLDCIYGK